MKSFQASRTTRLLLFFSVIMIIVVSVDWWLSPILLLLDFININASTIQGIESFIQIGIFIFGGGFAVMRWLRDTPNQSSANQSEAKNSDRNPSTSSQKYSVTSEHVGAVGENNTVTITINDTNNSGKKS